MQTTTTTLVQSRTGNRWCEILPWCCVFLQDRTFGAPRRGIILVVEVRLAASTRFSSPAPFFGESENSWVCFAASGKCLSLFFAAGDLLFEAFATCIVVIFLRNVEIVQAGVSVLFRGIFLPSPHSKKTTGSVFFDAHGEF